MPSLSKAAPPVPTPRIASILDTLREPIEELGADVQRLDKSVSLLEVEAQADRALTQRIEMRLQALEGRLASFDGFPPAPKEHNSLDIGNSPPDKQTSPRPSGFGLGVGRPSCRLLACDRLIEYSIGESLWDAPALIGLPQLGSRLASALLLCSVLLNTVVQLYIVGVLLKSDSFIKSQLWERLFGSSQRWRVTEAHKSSHVDSSETSLVSRVCGRDESLSVAEDQSSILNEVNAYLGLENDDLESDGLGTGPMLCTVCIFLFAVVIVRDLRNAFSSFLATMSVARGPTTKVVSDQLVAVSRGRIVGIITILFCRVIVAVALLYTGIMWLSFTSSITDLILNVTALNFIMDLDELLFQTTVPSAVHRLVADLKPLTFKQPRFHLEALLPMLLVAGIVIVSVQSLVVPTASSMLDVKRELCGGFLNFVVIQNPAGFVQSRETLPFKQGNTVGGILVKAVEELKSHKPIMGTPQPIFSNFAPDAELFNSFSGSMTEDVATNSPCSDLDVYAGGAALRDVPNYFTTVMDASRVYPDAEFNPDTWRCADYRVACDNTTLLRLICPVTCGCDDPTAGQPFRSVEEGCPDTCQPIFRAKMLERPCEDLDVANTSNWTRYWTGYLDSVGRRVPRLRTDAEYLGFIARQASRGCQEMEKDPAFGHGFCSSKEPLMNLFGADGMVGFCPKTCCLSPDPPDDCPRACSS